MVEVMTRQLIIKNNQNELIKNSTNSDKNITEHIFTLKSSKYIMLSRCSFYKNILQKHERTSKQKKPLGFYRLNCSLPCYLIYVCGLSQNIFYIRYIEYVSYYIMVY